VREHLVAHDGVSHLQNTAFPSDKKFAWKRLLHESTAFSFPIRVKMLIKILRNEDALDSNFNIKN
jgi:hypothetical protein